ncbi:MAG TPA: hypothetical protein VD968_02035 [Pyrinomonadaceae bacterium]|nr:hypothetical protein [Pyrinomonadaceae bacterium]
MTGRRRFISLAGAAVVLACLTPALAARRSQRGAGLEVSVPAGTEVLIRARQDIFSSTVLEGETIDFFEVAEDVTVGGRVVIRRGARALARVVVAKRPRRLGRGGKLEILVEQTVTVDGQWALLRGEPLKEKGRPRVAEMAGLAVFMGPGGAMLEGKNARIKAGAVAKTLTAEEMSVAIRP